MSSLSFACRVNCAHRDWRALGPNVALTPAYFKRVPGSGPLRHLLRQLVRSRLDRALEFLKGLVFAGVELPARTTQPLELLEVLDLCDRPHQQLQCARRVAH